MPSFEQNKKNKKWSCRFRIMEHGVEKNKRLSGFDTKKECNQAYLDFMKTYNAEEHIEKTPKDITFEELFVFYSEAIKTNVKESSALALNQRVQKILPYFKGKIISKLTVKDILEFKNELNKTNYSFKYKSSLFAALVHILNYAVKYLDLKENVAQKEGNFKKSLNDKIQTKLRFWEYEQFLEFDRIAKENIKTFRDEIFRIMYVGYYLTGARKNELNAITWNDVDFDNKTIMFNKTITRKNDKNEYRVTLPKTQNSIRTTFVISSYFELLKKIKIEMAKEKGFSSEWFVFGGKTPIPETTIQNRFAQLTELAGLPRIRLHDLRHSHVSYMINHCGNDVSTIYVIAERIGDRPEQIFLTYGHLFPSKQKKIVELMENNTSDAFLD